MSTVLLLQTLQAEGENLKVTPRHINRLRRRWKTSRSKGRPYKNQTRVAPETKGTAIQLRPNVPMIGIHLFACWLEEQGSFEQVVVALEFAVELYRQEHPREEFPLLFHRPETLKKLFMDQRVHLNRNLRFGRNSMW